MHTHTKPTARLCKVVKQSQLSASTVKPAFIQLCFRRMAVMLGNMFHVVTISH